MKTKFVASAVALASVSMALLAASIAPASAWNFWRHHHDHDQYYHRAPVIVEPSVGIGVGVNSGDFGVGAFWASPQPGWYWHPYSDWSGHDSQWRSEHPYHPGPSGGIYLQF